MQEERYVVDADIGPVLADLYRRHMEGEGFSKLAIWLNINGFKTVRGRQWSTNTIKSYMDSGFAAGLLRIHDPDCKCSAKKGATSGSCKNYFLVQGAHEEIIDYDLWKKYREHRARVAEIPPRARVSTYELSGLGRCGSCRGYPGMVSKRLRDGTYVTAWAYRCQRRATMGADACPGLYIWRHQAEEAVHEWLFDQAAVGIDAAEPEPGFSPSENVHQATAELRSRAEQAVKRATDAIARLRADYAMDPDDWDPGEYEAARAQLQQRRRDAQSQLDELTEVQQLPTKESFAPLIVSTAAEWLTLDAAGRNRVLRTLVRRVAFVRHAEGTSGTSIEVHPLGA